MSKDEMEIRLNEAEGILKELITIPVCSSRSRIGLKKFKKILNDTLSYFEEFKDKE